MRAATVLGVVSDPRLNSDSKAIVLFVAGRGKGKHEISGTKILEILNHCGERKKAHAIRLAMEAGWLSRTKGGWGSPDSFQFNDLTVSSNNVETEVATVPAFSEVNAKKVDTTRTGNKEERESSSCSYIGHDLSEKVGVELAKAEWNGFRNSLKDYFKNRVPTENQWGYLMTVRTWFQGSTAAPKGFGKLTNAQQCLLMASAVNELLAHSPTEEKLAYRSSQGLPGNTSTLRSKIEYHIRRQGSRHSGVGREPEQLSIGHSDFRFPEEKDDE